MDQSEIYEKYADRYDDLVAAEDCDHHLLPALTAIAPLRGASVLEVGVGTGRITRLLAPLAARVEGVERAAAMLDIARRHLTNAPHVALHLGEAEALPVASGWADVAIAGWVFGHFRLWMPEGWRDAVGRALGEMRRALKPGGSLIVIETLGTGHTEPSPPRPELAEYYRWMEEEQGLTRSAIRTDYQFENIDRAAEVTGFFFGDPFAKKVREQAWSRVPECTGLWSRAFP